MAFQPSRPADTPALFHDFADRLPELAALWQPQGQADARHKGSAGARGAAPAPTPDLAAGTVPGNTPGAAPPAPGPRLLTLNEELAASLGLDADWLGSPAGVRFLLGRELPGGASPVAQFYSGHQFGSFNPQMGDGRAVLLGEVRDPATGELSDLHVKGAGTTPLTRPGGDGKTPLSAALREFLLSEFMHAAGIPTARSLAVIATGQKVTRRVSEPAAAIVRVAPSHLRVGTFQAARLIDPDGERGLLRRVADMAIDRHYPRLRHVSPAADRYVELYRAVAANQARLIAAWMRLGFIHGVMNTDNTAIAGITLDYGPAAFLDRLEPEAVFSSIDTHGRYAFGRQPAIGGWNLARLAEAMLPLFRSSPPEPHASTRSSSGVPSSQDATSPAGSPGPAGEDASVALAAAQAALDEYSATFQAALTEQFADALGLDASTPAHRHLVADFQQLAEDARVDMQQLLRRLTDHGTLRESADPALQQWVRQWRAAGPDRERMGEVNPVYYPRNAHVEEAIAAALAGDLGPFDQLSTALRSPFTRRVGLSRWEEPTPSPEGFRTVCGT